MQRFRQKNRPSDAKKGFRLVANPSQPPDDRHAAQELAVDLGSSAAKIARVSLPVEMLLQLRNLGGGP